MAEGLFVGGIKAASVALLMAAVPHAAAGAASPSIGGSIDTGAPPVHRAQAGGLKPGEYACFGSGGRILIGLGFKALAGGRYTDLDGGSPGAFAVTGDTIVFKGGHLDGQTGRGLRNNTFTIGSASCEPG